MMSHTASSFHNTSRAVSFAGQYAEDMAEQTEEAVMQTVTGLEDTALKALGYSTFSAEEIQSANAAAESEVSSLLEQGAGSLKAKSPRRKGSLNL